MAEGRSSIQSDNGGGRTSIQSDKGGRSSLQSEKGARLSIESGKGGRASIESEKGGRRGSLKSDGGDLSSSDADTTMAPRSTKTTDMNDDDFDILNDEGDDEGTILKTLGTFLGKQAKAFVRNFVDYGPPYTRKPFDAALVNECSKPVVNHMELHNLLNKRQDPNIADPEDLYYFPIHWCARNIHFMAMKMLCRAGAKVNVTNELGCAPLSMCVMMKIPPDKRSDQLKMTKYLLEKGADPNNRDKGGFCAIDHAAVNQDFQICQMLLEYGANVLRENHTLVAKRNHILRNVYEPKVFKLLFEQLQIEEEEAERKRIIEEKLASEAAAERHHVKLHQSLDKRKQKRLAREAARDTTAKEEEIAKARMETLAHEMEANLKAKEKFKHKQGLWKKDEVDHWTFHVKEPERFNSMNLYNRDRNIMQKLYELNELDQYNARWKQITGHKGGLELHWTRADPFTLPEVVYDSAGRPVVSSNSVGYTPGGLESRKTTANNNNDNNNNRSRLSERNSLSSGAAIATSSSTTGSSKGKDIRGGSKTVLSTKIGMAGTGDAKKKDGRVVSIAHSSQFESFAASAHPVPPPAVAVATGGASAVAAGKMGTPLHSGGGGGATAAGATAKISNSFAGLGFSGGGVHVPVPVGGSSSTSMSTGPALAAPAAGEAAGNSILSITGGIDVQKHDENDAELEDEEDLDEIMYELSTF